MLALSIECELLVSADTGGPQKHCSGLETYISSFVTQGQWRQVSVSCRSGQGGAPTCPRVLLAIPNTSTMIDADYIDDRAWAVFTCCEVVLPRMCRNLWNKLPNES